MKISLKNKISLSITGMVLLAGILATTTIFFVARSQFIDYERGDMTKIADRSEHEIEGFFRDQERSAKNIAEQPELKKYLGQSTSTPQDPEILKILERYYIPEEHSAIYLMDEEGGVQVSTDPDFVGKNYAFRQYFRLARQGNPAVYMAVGKTSGEPGYYFSHPIQGEEGIGGVLVVKLRPDLVEDIIQLDKDRPSEDSDEIDLMLVDELGVVIAVTDPDKKYKNLGKINLNKKEQGELERRFPGQEIGSLDHKGILRRLNTSDSLSVYDEVDGRQEILEVRDVDNTPYTLILEVGTDRVFGYIYNIAFVLAGFVFFAALVSVFIIYLLVWWFMKPLYEIEDNIKNINKGDYDVVMDVNTGDEWEYLANSFNKMVKDLAEEKRNVDKKIKERTERLRKTNKAMIGRELKMRELKEENKKLKQRLKNKKK